MSFDLGKFNQAQMADILRQDEDLASTVGELFRWIAERGRIPKPTDGEAVRDIANRTQKSIRYTRLLLAYGQTFLPPEPMERGETLRELFWALVYGVRDRDLTGHLRAWRQVTGGEVAL